jgi:hypothetical protein
MDYTAYFVMNIVGKDAFVENDHFTMKSTDARTIYKYPWM